MSASVPALRYQPSQLHPSTAPYSRHIIVALIACRPRVSQKVFFAGVHTVLGDAEPRLKLMVAVLALFL